MNVPDLLPTASTTPGPTGTTPGAAQSFVVEHASGRAWMLQTPGSSLVVVVHTSGALAQRYWGSRLDLGSLEQLVSGHRDKWNSSFQRPAELDEQLPVEGGHRWTLPALQVRFADGVRSLQLDFASARVEGAELVLLLRDRIEPLAVELHYRLHERDDVIDRWIVITNASKDSDVRVLRLDSGSWLLPDLSAYRLSSSHGYWGGETQLSRLALPRGEHRIGSRQGVTGMTANPWLMVDDGSATEDAGEVWTVALAWSGSWHLTAQHRPEGVVSVTGGWSQEGVEHHLAPGATLTSPLMHGLYSTGGFGQVSRTWHDAVRERVLPAATELRPVLYNSWEATEFTIDMATELDLAERAAALGVELFVVDDGWFHGRVDDSAGLGDWWPDEEKFPEGLRPLSDRVHELGMAFGIWVEPEMVNVNSELFRAHPEWVMRWPGREGTEIRNQRLLDFGLSEVREHTITWLDTLVTDSRIEFVKWDMNRPFTDPGRVGDLAASDEVWRTHTEGVYAVMDAVRQRHPELRLEGCSSGGGRIDLGILQRVDQVWTSDNTDALDRQVIQHGYSQIYPATAMTAWVTDHTNVVSERTIPLKYRFHVAMAGVLGLGADIRTWSPQDLATAKHLIEVYKQIRGTVQHGQQFRLGGVPGSEQSAVQYNDEGSTVVFAYEPHRSLSTSPRRIRLRGLDSEVFYRDSDSNQVFSGAYLMGHGISANRGENDRGWDNLRFSNRDYVSTLTVLARVPEHAQA